MPTALSWASKVGGEIKPIFKPNQLDKRWYTRPRRYSKGLVDAYKGKAALEYDHPVIRRFALPAEGAMMNHKGTRPNRCRKTAGSTNHVHPNEVQACSG